VQGGSQGTAVQRYHECLSAASIDENGVISRRTESYGPVAMVTNSIRAGRGLLQADLSARRLFLVALEIVAGGNPDWARGNGCRWFGY
jgi:hypothetical protein